MQSLNETILKASYNTLLIVLLNLCCLPCPLQPPPDIDPSPQFPATTDQLQCQVQDDLCPGWYPHHDDQRTQGLHQWAQGGTPTDRYVCTNDKFGCIEYMYELYMNTMILEIDVNSPIDVNIFYYFCIEHCLLFVVQYCSRHWRPLPNTLVELMTTYQ